MCVHGADNMDVADPLIGEYARISQAEADIRRLAEALLKLTDTLAEMQKVQRELVSITGRIMVKMSTGS